MQDASRRFITELPSLGVRESKNFRRQYTDIIYHLGITTNTFPMQVMLACMFPAP